MHRTMPLKGFAAILAAMLIVFLALHLMLKGDLRRKTEEERAIQETLAKLEEENKDLKNRLELAGTDDYIVVSARTDYSFVGKDDIRFEFSNPKALYLYSPEEMQILADESTD